MAAGRDPQVSAAPARRLLPVVIAAYAFWINMVGTTLPTPLYPLYSRQLGITSLTITVIFATYAIGVVVSLVLFGRLSDEVGRRPVLLGGLLASAASAVAFLLAQDLLVLLIGRALSGLSAGIFTGTATATIIDLSDAHTRKRAGGLAAAANLGGLGCGSLFSGLLASFAPAPLRLSYAIDLGLVVLALVALALMLPETVPRKPRMRLQPQRLNVPRQARGVFIRAAAAGSCSFAVSSLYGAVMPGFLTQDLHLKSPALAGFLVFLLFGLAVGGQFSAARLPERIALPGGSATLGVGAALLTLAVALKSFPILLLAAAVTGLGQTVAISAGLAALGARSPAGQRGEVASSFFVVLYCALAFPIVAVGLATQFAALRSIAIIFGIIVTAICAFVVVSFMEELRRPTVAQ
ncbi:MAG TPA: MFS transporter [Candidatus Sulfotelmatobacter sp.]|nr:MFS transporter [Candidatus Sulfotelmatobacter sp.]